MLQRLVRSIGDLFNFSKKKTHSKVDSGHKLGVCLLSGKSGVSQFPLSHYLNGLSPLCRLDWQTF